VLLFFIFTPQPRSAPALLLHSTQPTHSLCGKKQNQTKIKGKGVQGPNQPGTAIGRVAAEPGKTSRFNSGSKTEETINMK
jgi:hypothetical protein